MPRSAPGMRLIMTKSVQSTTHISDGRATGSGLRHLRATAKQIMGRNKLPVLVSSWKIQTQEPGDSTDQQQQRKQSITPFKHLHLTTFPKSASILAEPEQPVYGKNVYFRHGKWRATRLALRSRRP